MRTWRAVAGILAGGLVSIGISPAWACACGGYLADEESRARATGENALVRFDGRTEEIVLSMAIRGSSKKAAWIMPVPAAAEVSLGDPATFTELVRLTRPKVVVKKTYWPFRDTGLFGGHGGDAAGAAPGSAVDVREQMVLGPFEVVRLGGSNATQVTAWLRTNGYAVPDTLAANLTPYLAERWEIVAVKLAPKEADGTLGGETPPLRLKFASKRIVYPMRLSKGATTSQAVTVYVAAPYRVDASTVPDASLPPELLYAGRVDGAQAAQLTAPTNFLTAYSSYFSEPGRITNDYTFTRSATDEGFQRTTYVTENESFWSTLGVVVGGLLLLGGGAAVVARRVR
ncbi:hypothetical protein BWI15_13100 [Kribbella sp. ALI-6-A]|uniref:DUF2330 domain-containing protein n=1 Tax=Kribbella sp. ALI-6-A TaxID=1933817 RepID=UPI00097C1EBD|nr:DUF2330 domain-containing protein [Kribbella sp. ALI-6-A]ONI74267.1 hypothetical protein BWI15_13100 [Kribbella sp. ALI-6-A]